MSRVGVTLLVAASLAAGWFGARWHYGRTAEVAQVLAEAKADSIAVLLYVSEGRTEQAQESADSAAKTAVVAVAALEAAQVPTRPPEPPQGQRQGPRAGLSVPAEWVAYADSLEVVVERQGAALFAVQAANLRLGILATTLRDENALLRERGQALERANRALAEQLAVATKPDPWYWNDVTKPVYAAAGGVVVSFAVDKALRGDDCCLEGMPR